MTFVYLGIGNSDDKLPQGEWAALQIEVQELLREFGAEPIGDWYSSPHSIYQNACFAFTIDEDVVPELQGQLTAMATEFKQDAFAWNEIVTTYFLGPQYTGKALNHPNSDRWTGGDKKDAP